MRARSEFLEFRDVLVEEGLGLDGRRKPLEAATKVAKKAKRRAVIFIFGKEQCNQAMIDSEQDVKFFFCQEVEEVKGCSAYSTTRKVRFR
jgi:hypothetical protein